MDLTPTHCPLGSMAQRCRARTGMGNEILTFQLESIPTLSTGTMPGIVEPAYKSLDPRIIRLWQWYVLAWLIQSFL